jgi:hypothetical protein
LSTLPTTAAKLDLLHVHFLPPALALALDIEKTLSVALSIVAPTLLLISERLTYFLVACQRCQDILFFHDLVQITFLQVDELSIQPVILKKFLEHRVHFHVEAFLLVGVILSHEGALALLADHLIQFPQRLHH